jgi:hypothetical protein
MPSRLLREGILTSERVDLLDWQSEVFYRRLMSKVDDHGLYDGRPSVLRASLYPLRVDRVREADISRWIAICEKAGVIALYMHAGKPYVRMLDTRWPARSEPKFPVPSDENTVVNSCAQPFAPAHLDVVVGGGVVVVDEEQDAPPLASPAGKSKDKSGQGTRLSADWSLPLDWAEWARKERPDLDPVRQADRFADYWRAQAGAKGRKADWLATWRNWIRNEKPGTTPPPRATPSGKPAAPTESPLENQLNWIAEMVRRGAMTDEEAVAARAQATAKHRSHA